MEHAPNELEMVHHQQRGRVSVPVRAQLVAVASDRFLLARGTSAVAKSFKG